MHTWNPPKRLPKKKKYTFNVILGWVINCWQAKGEENKVYVYESGIWAKKKKWPRASFVISIQML